MDGLESLPKLEILDLSGSASSLPDPSALSSLPQLQELYLRSEPNLQHFTLLDSCENITDWFWNDRRMKLSQFPLGLISLQQLRILDLSQNSLLCIPEVLPIWPPKNKRLIITQPAAIANPVMLLNASYLIIGQTDDVVDEDKLCFVLNLLLCSLPSSLSLGCF